MRMLGCGVDFAKIDLAHAHNQACWRPTNQRLSAVNRHKDVFLQKRLGFSIVSAPGHFQEIMEQLTSDLLGVGGYLNDIIVSGTDAADHVTDLRGILKRLSKKEL